MLRKEQQGLKVLQEKKVKKKKQFQRGLMFDDGRKIVGDCNSMVEWLLSMQDTWELLHWEGRDTRGGKE